jgi:hypothetical protein
VVGKYKGLTAYYYGYFGYGRDAVPNNKTYTENDFAVDWTQTLVDGKLALTGGGYWYTYPNGKSGPDTFEFYGKAAWTDNILNPYIALNWDIDAFKGAYAAVGVSHTFDISKPLNLKDGMTLSIIPSAQLGIDLGYNSKRSQSNVNWNDVLLGVNVPFYITPAFCLHAQAQISIALNSLSDLNQGNERIFNLGASYAF